MIITANLNLIVVFIFQCYNTCDLVDDYGDDEDDGDGDDDDSEGEVDETNNIAPGNEHTGRWTRGEHELFLEALRKFGRVYNNLYNYIVILK